MSSNCISKYFIEKKSHQMPRDAKLGYSCADLVAHLLQTATR